MYRRAPLLSGFLFLYLIFFTAGCEKINELRSDYLVFPLGRSFLAGSAVQVTIGGEPFDGDFMYDYCGSYWLRIKKKDLARGEEVVITYTRRNVPLQLLSTEDAVDRNWLNPVYYIDSDNEILAAKAEELTRDLTTNYQKAASIQHFVISHVSFRIYNSSFEVKASETYEMAYGTCMNFSRLFVALCRAAGIPSRTVWGNVYNHDDNGIYDYHHQWAEFRDEEGKWHALDFNYTRNIDLNDIRYLDLFCAPEENLVTMERDVYDLPFEDVKYHHDYPATYTGRMGFELIADERPDSMVIQFRYVKD